MESSGVMYRPWRAAWPSMQATRLRVCAGEDSHVRARNHEHAAFANRLHGRVEEGSGGTIRVEVDNIKAFARGWPRRVEQRRRVAHVRDDGVCHSILLKIAAHRGNRARINVVRNDLAQAGDLERVAQCAQPRRRECIQHAQSSPRPAAFALLAFASLLIYYSLASMLSLLCLPRPPLFAGPLHATLARGRLRPFNCAHRATRRHLPVFACPSLPQRAARRSFLFGRLSLPHLRKLLQREDGQVAVGDLRGVVEDALLAREVQRGAPLAHSHLLAHGEQTAERGPRRRGRRAGRKEGRGGSKAKGFSYLAGVVL
eukprot:scaffold214765_cov31-Tisochrysis_lutea.AAC.1